MKANLKNILQTLKKGLKREVKLYRLLIKDKRTPLISKILMGAALGYLFMPFDIIPDFIPVIGHIDDALIVPGLIYLALKFIPDDLILEHRKNLEISN